MCGIVGAVAQRDVVPLLVDGLKRLEYRGYDSAGIAVLVDDTVRRVRRTGRVAEMESAALAELDVAQTRLQRLRERLESDVALAREAVRAAEVQREAGITRARLLRERAELVGKSFDVGETPLPDLLRALAAAAEADAALARHTAALGLARARLQQALGLLP